MNGEFVVNPGASACRQLLYGQIAYFRISRGGFRNQPPNVLFAAPLVSNHISQLTP